MAIDFPNSPAVNDTFTVGSTVWKWDGTVWSVIAGASITTIDGLTDVDTTGAVSGNYLKFDGTNWVDGGIALGTDTSGNYVSDVSAGTGISVSHTPSEGSTATVSINASLDNLSDVTITSPSSGQTLAYDGSAWVNSQGMPSGSITQFAGSTAPSGWLSCDGGAISRTTYAALFAVIGTTYGAGDGSTTFNLPNMKGKVPVGIDASQTEFDALGESGGAKTHTLTEAQMPSHTHIQNAHSHTGSTSTDGSHSHGYVQPYNTSGMGPAGGYGYYYYDRGATTDAAGSHSHSLIIASATPVNQSTGGGQAHNNLQPYIVLNYIIKA